MPIRWNKLLIVLFFLVVNVSFSQENDPRTIFPYGGIPDSSRFEKWMEIIPLNFKTANFDSAQFDSLADFLAAQFHSQVDFRVAQFHSRADFGGANFDSLADFKSAKFGGRADFGWAQFHSLANFGGAQFDSINFDGSVIKDEILFGSNENRLIDFTNTNFIEDTKLVLYTPINFVIQPEKIKYISLLPQLDYFSKKKIIEDLKNTKSFKDDNKAKFELSYIFDKSTMYLEQSNKYEEKWYQVWKYPKWFLNTLYYLTMGLGYQPFRLAWWMLGFIIIFTFVYYFWMPGQINKYVAKGDEKKTTSGSRRKRARRTANPHFTDKILNCFYFSSMMFFTFRLKRDILTFFNTKEKRVIAGEWLIGLIIYISFLTLSTSGSILHTLKSLFVG